MRNHFSRAFALVTALALLHAAAATAGPQYVDGSGYAASGYDVVAYFDKAQSPSGQPQPQPTPGLTSITASYNGARFAFASDENRNRFLVDPEKYAPQYDGHCAYGVAKGGKVPGDPTYWRIVDGRLYFNLDRRVAAQWERDIPGYVQSATTAWPSLEAKPASDQPVPELEAHAAPIGK
jgi:YHS domain-containing protein